MAEMEPSIDQLCEILRKGDRGSIYIRLSPGGITDVDVFGDCLVADDAPDPFVTHWSVERKDYSGTPENKSWLIKGISDDGNMRCATSYPSPASQAVE